MNRLINLPVSSEFILNTDEERESISCDSHASLLVIHKTMEGSGLRLNASISTLWTEGKLLCNQNEVSYIVWFHNTIDKLIFLHHLAPEMYIYERLKLYEGHYFLSLLNLAHLWIDKRKIISPSVWCSKQQEEATQVTANSSFSSL